MALLSDLERAAGGAAGASAQDAAALIRSLPRASARWRIPPAGEIVVVRMLIVTDAQGRPRVVVGEGRDGRVGIDLLDIRGVET